MKKVKFILPVLFFSSVLTLSYSYSSAEVEQVTNLTFVDEKNSLIAISYSENKTFTLTNNTLETIEIKDIYISGPGSVLDINNSFIMSGNSKEYIIEGDSIELVGLEMEIFISSENGEMLIKSTLPQFKIEEVNIEIAPDTLKKENTDVDTPLKDVPTTDTDNQPKQDPTPDTDNQPKQDPTPDVNTSPIDTQQLTDE